MQKVKVESHRAEFFPALSHKLACRVMFAKFAAINNFIVLFATSHDPLQYVTLHGNKHVVLENHQI